MRYLKKRLDFRSLISEQVYVDILNDFSGKFLLLENYFFDTEDLGIGQNESMLRLRHYASQSDFNFSLIIPYKDNITENYSISPLCCEDRNKLFASPAIIPECELRSKLVSFTKNYPVKFIGKVQTRRFVMENAQGLVKIDKNEYPNGHIDFEVEFSVIKGSVRSQESYFILTMDTYNADINYPKNKYQRLLLSQSMVV